MGDSDDDYDRKRRDKFRGERSVGADRRERRDDWVDRGRPKPDYRDYRGHRSSYSPGREYPPLKRMRGDYDDARPRYGGHDPYAGAYGWAGGHDHYGMHPSAMGGGYGQMGREHHHRDNVASSDVQTQPCLMTLKQFLATQDDSISDSDAIEKYNDYKLDFRRQQLNEFFVAHKDEEWFKLKYHPEESIKRKEEQLGFLKKRVEVFMELLNNDSITGVTVDTNQSEKLLRVLDTVVIKLEGGTDEDIEALDEKPVEVTAEPEAMKEKESSPEKDNNKDATGDKTSNEELKNDSVQPNGSGAKKRKRSKSGSGSDSSSSSSDSESEDEDKKSVPADDDEKMEDESEVAKPTQSNDETVVPATDSEALANGETEKSGENDDDNKESAEKEENKSPENEDAQDEESAEVVDLVKDKVEVVSRALHKTSSIFLRNLAPTITKAEVEAVCRRYDGYLRVAIADPLVERRWFRRGWVSFRRDVNIKEICWNLNNIRLRDCELGAIVNRDLSRRVRPVNGVTNHKTIIRNDIKLCAKIIHNLDEKNPLWTEAIPDDQKKKKEGHDNFGFKSKNPVLQNITDYLIEEASAEEDELLGLSGESGKVEGDAGADENFERDLTLISVLDKLILYLRIVHSVDFYNHCEYPYEDEMPNRCGIIHARMPVPTTKVTSQEVQDYTKNFETKMDTFLQKNVTLVEDELKKLGSKDPDQEVEKFITANSQELAKDKWLCPLSGKKFKGPDFIRKHILNKHGEKVEEVRKEVEYFNNYLKDGKRPQLPEHPSNLKKEAGNGKDNPMMGYRPQYPGPGFGSSYGNAYGPPPMAIHRGRGPGGFSQRRPMPADFRPIVHYRDLDAPREPDDFL